MSGTVTYDALGRLVIPGAPRILIDETFGAAALPSTLIATTGTATFGAMSTTAGYLQMTSGAVSGNGAKVNTAYSVKLDQYKAVLWEAQGLVYDSATVQMVMALSGSSSMGGFFKQDSTDATGYISMSGSATAVVYNVRDLGEATRRRNIGALLIPSTAEFYILEDDAIMAYRKHTGVLTSTAVTPGVELATREAVAHNFKVNRLKLTVYT